jgi:peptide/nickel transport system ATP-binding protein
MIFQEPMSALNPVFTAGDQISEIILLHERRELAEAVLKKLDESRKPNKKYRKATRKLGNKGEFRCSNCNGIVLEDQDVCPQCDSSFVRNPGGKRLRLGHGFYKRVYTKMAANPDDRTLAVLAKIPLIRRYRQPMIREANEKALRMLRLVRIPDPKNVMKSFPHELSGGMQQRVMIAIALSCRPQLLIADEPTTALDVTIQAQILKLIQELQEEMGTSVLMITHNLGIVAEVCDRVGVMYAGCLVERANTESIFKEPLHPYTQGLMNSIPKVDLELTRLETIEGNVPNLIKPPSGCRFHTRCPYVMEHCKKEKPLLIEIIPGHSVACHLYGGVDNG